MRKLILAKSLVNLNSRKLIPAKFSVKPNSQKLILAKCPKKNSRKLIPAKIFSLKVKLFCLPSKFLCATNFRILTEVLNVVIMQLCVQILNQKTLVGIHYPYFGGSLNIPFRRVMKFCIILHFSTTTRARIVKLGYSVHYGNLH